MSRESQARRIAAHAAYGGGGLVATSATALAVLWAEAKLARRRVGPVSKDTHAVDATYLSPGVAGTPLRIAVLGDSAAAGLGADSPTDTPAVIIARGLSEQSGRPVRMVNAAVVGAQTADVDDQIDAIKDFHPDLVVLLVGANDVTHLVPATTSVRHLDQIVRRLRDLGAEVVMGTCPDLGTIRPVPQPLRAIGRRRSRALAAAQMITVVEAGGRAVSLGSLLGPEFDKEPQHYFSSDRFHPSSLGYRRVAEVLLPTVCAALGYGPDPEAALDPHRHEDVLPVSEAAVQAVDAAGSELSAAQVDGRDRSSRGRWATVRHRIPLRRRPAATDEPAEADPGTGESEGEAEGPYGLRDLDE
jgi:lysophospholipase L1-like esterase